MTAESHAINGHGGHDPRVSGLLLQHAQAIKIGDFVRALSVLRQIVDLEHSESSPLDQRWLRLASCPNLLIEDPPRQIWLLDRYEKQRSIGVLPRGRTGLITGTGGTGKTYAVMQLAIAVATGGFWLDTFRAVGSGHVLLALAEEDLDEARRRLWRAANAAELSADQRRDVAGRIDLLPLAGMPVALTSTQTPGVVQATELAIQFRNRLQDRGVDWALIVIDPLSRWAGGGAETENESATRFAQVIESLCAVRGTPSALVNHHSSKVSAESGNSDARGVTAIRDGFRWMVSLDAVVDKETGVRGIRLRNKKSNYSLEFDDLMLIRNAEPGIEGTLRLASASEWDGMQARGGGREVTDEEMQNRVVETVRKRPGLTSATQIADLTQGTKGKVLAAVKALRLSGRIIVESGSFAIHEQDAANQ